MNSITLSIDKGSLKWSCEEMLYLPEWCSALLKFCNKYWSQLTAFCCFRNICNARSAQWANMGGQGKIFFLGS